jgi:hypothetical protein
MFYISKQKGLHWTQLTSPGGFISYSLDIMGTVFYINTQIHGIFYF